MTKKLKQTESGATVLPPTAIALVMLEDGETHLCVPKWPDDYLASDRQLALAMLAVKFMKEPEWVESLAEEFAEAAD